ncbi:MAG: hypothetical protein BWY79_01744 [Actinobacteria bacterium ADurb.Bin444]|nr:MAG: hypothetical protein BWY79_01744 [Actinobacteria bacterium ADurb.Bin444]
MVDDISVPPLLPTHQRRPDHKPGSRIQTENLVNDLLLALSLDGPTTDPAVRMADARIQQPQIVVDLRDSAHRRARISRRGLLIDGDGGRQTLNGVNVGLVHLPQELPSVGG